MILSDKSIRERLTSGWHAKPIVITPITDLEQQLQPASFDIRLGDDFVYNGKRLGKVDEVHVHQGNFILGTSLEWIEIPYDLVARVEGKSSLGRQGLVIHATAGFIDPGFKGEITFEISNVSPTPIVLTPGMYIAQLAFHQLDRACARPYGPARGSHYYQQRGATPAYKE